MIDRIFQTVKIILNSDGRGNVSPNEFNLILHNVVLELFESMFFEVNQILTRQNRGLINGGLENVPNKIRQRIQHYITPPTALTYSGGTFSFPADLRYFDTVLYNGTIEIELCNSNKDFLAVQTVDETDQFPVGLKQGSTLTVAPSSITSNVTLSYLRNPLQAKWTYTEVDGVEIFNPSANDYVDVDIHPGAETDVILKVLKNFGINLKEQDIQAITQREEAIEFNKELRM